MKKRKNNFISIISGIAFLYLIVIIFYIVKIHMDIRDKPNYSSEVYQIQTGDTLWGIAEANASSKTDIREWIAEVKSINELESCEIKSGEEIIILK